MKKNILILILLSCFIGLYHAMELPNPVLVERNEDNLVLEDSDLNDPWEEEESVTQNPLLTLMRPRYRRDTLSKTFTNDLQEDSDLNDHEEQESYAARENPLLEFAREEYQREKLIKKSQDEFKKFQQQSMEWYRNCLKQDFAKTPAERAIRAVEMERAMQLRLIKYYMKNKSNNPDLIDSIRYLLMQLQDEFKKFQQQSIEWYRNCLKQDFSKMAGARATRAVEMKKDRQLQVIKYYIESNSNNSGRIDSIQYLPMDYLTSTDYDSLDELAFLNDNDKVAEFFRNKVKIEKL